MHENPLSAAAIQQVLARVRSLAQFQSRRSQERFWIEGVRNFVQACDAKLDFDTVVYCPVLLKSRVAEMLIRRLGAAGVPRVRVTPEQFRAVSMLERASGVGAIALQRWTPLERADPRCGLCWLVIEQIRSPGNLGSILRTAEACSVGGVIFVGPYCDPFDPAVARASMGGISFLPLVRASVDELAAWIERHSVELVGLSPDAKRLWTDVPLAPSIAIVLGEERQGLSQRLRKLCGTRVRLPMTGRADSLNVSVAAGVMLYELVRRQVDPPATF